MPRRFDKQIFRTRDKFGKFIKFDEDESGENLVNVTVHNPVKRIYQLLSDIKKHQETTFAFKFTIPLIAIPIIMAVLFGLGGFQLGKFASPFCDSSFTPRSGQLLVTSVQRPPTQPFWEKLFFWPTPSPPALQTLTVLMSQNETITVNTKLDLADFHQKPVLVVGDFNACDHTLSLTSRSNISVL